MRGSEFVHSSTDVLYSHLQKMGLKRGGSYIDSPKWLKNKKSTINPKSNDDNCFHYSLTAALNHKQIKSHPERISKIKPLLISIVGKKYIFHHTQKTGKSLTKQ